MTTTAPIAFEGYEELIRKPLENGDRRSFNLITTLLENTPDFPQASLQAGPFGFLIKALSGITISSREARNHWKKITEHKRRLELKLYRTVNIRTACIDYYDQLGIDAPVTQGAAPSERISPQDRKAAGPFTKVSAPKTGAGEDGLPERITTPGFYQERLKEEMMRARRYKHALSLIMFNADLRTAAPETADKMLSVIVKLVKKAVRTVDILARHSDALFLLMLPNTNKREAMELAERLQNNIRERTNRIPGLAAGGITITIAVGQCSKDDAATDFIKRLEHLVETGKDKTPAAIYTLD
ncbi:MAG: diguanylate cyclase [Chitinispirillaceae bacterium]|jgi:diguanylate cyclase (GGDEF)-like protein